MGLKFRLHAVETRRYVFSCNTEVNSRHKSELFERPPGAEKRFFANVAKKPYARSICLRSNNTMLPFMYTAGLALL